MKHTRMAFALTAAALAVMPVIALAQITPASTGLQAAAAGGGLASTCSGTECIATVVGQVINIVLGFLGVVLMCIFLYAGFLWMTAGGEMENVKKATQMLRNAIAGLIIITASYAITTFVLDRLAEIAGGGGAATEEPVSCEGYDCRLGASLCDRPDADPEGCREFSSCCR